MSASTGRNRTLEPKDPTYKCHKCGEELEFEVKIGRRDMCPNCYAYLHCCLNCQHYDPYAPKQCRENPREHVPDKAEGNFCLYFTFKPVEDDRTSEVSAAKSKLLEVFGKGEGKSGGLELTKDDPRSKLDALFKKS